MNDDVRLFDIVAVGDDSVIVFFNRVRGYRLVHPVLHVEGSVFVTRCRLTPASQFGDLPLSSECVYEQCLDRFGDPDPLLTEGPVDQEVTIAHRSARGVFRSRVRLVVDEHGEVEIHELSKSTAAA